MGANEMEEQGGGGGGKEKKRKGVQGIVGRHESNSV